jgi:hypothetical protein
MQNAPTPLVGRAAVVADAVRRARRGQGSVFTGAPGSGGSRLLDEVQHGLRRVGARTVRLRVEGTSTRSPFLALLDRPTAEALDAGDRAALRNAVLRLPVDVLVVEDADLLDAADGALVAEIARAGTVVIANATGQGAPADALQRLADEALVVTTPLGPLTDAEVRDLAEQLLGDPIDGQLAHALATASEGRPGTLSELVDDGVGSRSITHADGAWHLAAPLPAARSVRAAVLDAFSALPPDQRGWIAAVAVARSIARDLAPRIAAPATGAAAEQAGWTVSDETGSTRIVSVPVATAVIGSLDLRARIAVLRRLIGAAASTQRALSEDELVALARWRIELGDPTDPHEALALALRPETAEEDREALLRAALDGGAPAGAALADHYQRTRRHEEAIRLIGAALPGAESDDERGALIRIATMTTGIVERRSREALDALDAQLSKGYRHPDLLAVRAALLLLEGRPREAVGMATEVLEGDDPSVFAAAFAYLQLAVGLRELGDLRGALAAAQRFTAVDGLERAYPPGAALARWLPSEIAVAVGAELDGAGTVLAAEHAAVPAERRSVLCPPLAYTLGCIRTQQADPAAAVRFLREADGGSGAWRESWRPRVLAELTIAQTLAGALDDARSTHERLLRILCPPVQRGRVQLATAQLRSRPTSRGGGSSTASRSTCSTARSPASATGTRAPPRD